ncbi:MAG: D-glucuronyl C5-epimerase family protein [Thermoleophilia bacterium]
MVLGPPVPGPPGGLRDPDGMILTYREGHGFMVNPVATTGRWRGLNDEQSPEQLAEPLLQMAVRRGGGDTSLVWEYYDVAAEPDAMRPGVSGMAQARLAELLSTAYRRTGRRAFAEDAALALEGLALPVDGGGATSMVRLEGWDAARPWYVERAYPGEDPWTGAALNGFMVTLLSLRNAGNRLSQGPGGSVAVTTGTTADAAPPPDPVALRAADLARRLADRGALTLRAALPAHDLGDWSLYGILTRGRPRGTYRADLNYHCYHVFLLRALARTYPDLGFAQTADRWQGYVDERGLECPVR